MKPKKLATPKMGVPTPTGYVDQSQIGSATPPGVPATVIKPTPPQLGGPAMQKKLGAKLPAGAVLPGNEGKMQEMMGSATAKTGGQAGPGAKTPENVAADNKNYKGLLKKFQLY